MASKAFSQNGFIHPDPREEEPLLEERYPRKATVYDAVAGIYISTDSSIIQVTDCPR